MSRFLATRTRFPWRTIEARSKDRGHVGGGTYETAFTWPGGEIVARYRTDDPPGCPFARTELCRYVLLRAGLRAHFDTIVSNGEVPRSELSWLAAKWSW